MARNACSSAVHSRRVGTQRATSSTRSVGSWHTEAAPAMAAAAAGGLPRLKCLNLYNNDIGAAGMQALASAFAGAVARAFVHSFAGPIACAVAPTVARANG